MSSPATLHPSPKPADCRRLRADLVITCQQSGEGPAYVVNDPVAGKFVRLRSAEHLIASQLDGNNSLEDIRCRVESELDASLPMETLERFIHRLDQLELLEHDGDSPRARTKRKPGRVQGNALCVRVRMFDPDRLLKWVLGITGFCFTQWFLAVSAALIVLAAVVAMKNSNALASDLLGLVRLDLALVGVLIMLCVAMLHEFAHGLTCRRFGGEVREIGFLLIYFMPAFYCNVTSAWGFSEKSKRLAVTFAGVYCDLICWAVAILCWRITQPDTWIHQAALLVITMTGIRSFFNLNPLIKLDGYYLLGDWLDVPNLRQRAFQYLSGSIKSYLAANSDQRDVPRRLQRIYIAYGLLAFGYSVFLLALIASTIGGFLMTEYQGLGFTLFIVLLGLLLHRPIRDLIHWPIGMLRGARRSWAAGLRRVSSLVLACGAMYVLLFVCRWELIVVGDFEVLPIERVEVRSQLEGLLEQIYVEEGERVAAGQPIARICPSSLITELAHVEAEIQQKQAELKLLMAGPTAEQILLARRELATAAARVTETETRLAEAQRLREARLARATTAVEKCRASLEFAESRWNRSRSLWENRAASREEYEKAEQHVVECRKELEQAEAERELILADTLTELHAARLLADKQREEAQARLELLLAGPRAEQMDAAEAELSGLAARQMFLRGRIEQTTLVSPIQGIVVTRRLKENAGRWVRPGETVVQVQSQDRLLIEVAVPEKEIVDARPGTFVALKAHACPESTFESTVRTIAETVEADAGNASGPIVYVTTEVDDTTGTLKPGMTGRAKIYCGQQRIIDLSLRRLARLVKVEFWSWW